MKLSILIEDFLFHCEVERGLAPHTIDSYRHDLKQFISFVGARSSAGKSLRADRVRAFLTDMTRHRGLSASTVRRRLACLKSFARFAAQRHALANPFSDWRPTIKKPKRLPRALPKSDMVDLLSSNKHESDPETKFALFVLSCTGLRISELCALKVKDISPCGEIIRVLGKGSKDRIVYLTNEQVRTEMKHRRLERLTVAVQRP